MGKDFLFITYTTAETNTEPGETVAVRLTNMDTSPAIDVTVTFSSVTWAGDTELTISEEGPAEPEGFSLGEPATYYDISTTADYEGPVTICIDYSEVEYFFETDLLIYHFSDTEGDGIADTWEDVTTVVDTLNKIICGEVDSLSPFAFVEPFVGQTPVEIDIRPWSMVNLIVPWSHGIIPIAVLSSPSFDAPAKVDRQSLTFGRDGTEDSLTFCLRRARDVNRDGNKDLVCFFSNQKAAFQEGDTEGYLRGVTRDSSPIKGKDSVWVKVKPNPKTKGWKNKKKYH